MNPNKWKSVVISIDTYKKLKQLAYKNHRTLSGQFTYILETYMIEESAEHEITIAPSLSDGSPTFTYTGLPAIPDPE